MGLLGKHFLFPPPPPPSIFHFFCSHSNFCAITQLEMLAPQATSYFHIVLFCYFTILKNEMWKLWWILAIYFWELKVACRGYPASRGFSLVFLSVVLPFSSRFWLLAFCFGCFCAEEKTTKRMAVQCWETQGKSLCLQDSRGWGHNK